VFAFILRCHWVTKPGRFEEPKQTTFLEIISDVFILLCLNKMKLDIDRKENLVTITVSYTKQYAYNAHVKLYINNRFVARQKKLDTNTFTHHIMDGCTDKFYYHTVLVSSNGAKRARSAKHVLKDVSEFDIIHNGMMRTRNQQDDYDFKIPKNAESVNLIIRGICVVNVSWDGQQVSHTINGADMIVVPTMEGMMTVNVTGRIGSYSIRATVNKQDTIGVWGDNGRYAVIVGISDYDKMSDLNFCDEDSTDWYKYLVSAGYECKVFGDRNAVNYPRYDGLATKTNVRQAIASIVEHCKPSDKFVFVTSGHGSGDGKGDSHLNLLGDVYTDVELAADLKACHTKTEKIVIIDHCFSGGFLDNLRNCPNICAMTTCSKNGYGYDVSTYQNGAWTYALLEYAIKRFYKGGKNIPLRNIFNYAKKHYFSGSKKVDCNDMPMIFTNNNSITLN